MNFLVLVNLITANAVRTLEEDWLKHTTGEVVHQADCLLIVQVGVGFLEIKGTHVQCIPGNTWLARQVQHFLQVPHSGTLRILYQEVPTLGHLVSSNLDAELDHREVSLLGFFLFPQWGSATEQTVPCRAFRSHVHNLWILGCDNLPRKSLAGPGVEIETSTKVDRRADLESLG